MQYVASLQKKDTLDVLDSCFIEADNKYEAIAKANEEFKRRDKNYFRYAYVWVEEWKGPYAKPQS